MAMMVMVVMMMARMKRAIDTKMVRTTMNMKMWMMMTSMMNMMVVVSAVGVMCDVDGQC